MPPPPNPGFASSQGMAAPPSFGQQMQGLNSKITPFTSSLRDITRNFAAGFAKDPAVREQYSAQNAVVDESKRREQVAMRQQQIEQLVNNFESYAQAIQGNGGQVSPGTQKAMDQAVGLLTQIAPDQQQEWELLRDNAILMGSQPVAQDPYTLAPGEMRYGPDNQPIAGAPARPIEISPGGYLVDPNTGQPIFNAPMTPSQQGAGGVSISLPPAESEFQKGLGASRAKAVEDLEAAAVKSIGTVNQINASQALIQNMIASGNEPGRLAPLKADVANWMQSLNVDPESLGLPADAGPTQAVEATMNRLALNFIGAEQGGLPANNFTETDRQFVLDIAGSTSNTVEGLRLKAEVLKRAAEQNVKAANMWMNYPQTEEGYRQFVQDWRKTSISQDIFKDLRGASGTLKKSSGGTVQRDRAGGALPQLPPDFEWEQ